MRAWGWVWAAAVLLGGCDLFEYSPHEVRLEDSEREMTRKNLERLLARPAPEPLRFAVVSDTQRGLDETADFVESLNRRDDVAFVVHAGDLTDFGLAREFRWMHRVLAGLAVPYLTAVGNHDLLASGREIYAAMYGPLDYSFDWGRTRFVFLNTNSREFRFDGTVPDLAWLAERLRQAPAFDRAVVVGHVPPRDGDFDPLLAPGYERLLADSGTALVSLHGHQSHFRHQVSSEGGVSYVVADDVRKRSYLVVTLEGRELTVERVFF